MMCGIFGVVANTSDRLSSSFLNKIFRNLAISSSSRGKDSSGLCLYRQELNEVDIIKSPEPIQELLKKKQINEALVDAFLPNLSTRYAFGHARLVTNGTQLNHENNQPVLKKEVIGIHNGIIVNVEDLWARNSSLKREFEIDTEILLSLIEKKIEKEKMSIPKAVSESSDSVFGTVSAAILLEKYNRMVLFSNNGSLYKLSSESGHIFFASEESFLNRLGDKLNLREKIGNYSISQIIPQVIPQIARLVTQ